VWRWPFPQPLQSRHSAHHSGVVISKFFAADTEGRRLWISGVLRGIFAQQGPCDLCATLGALVPQLSEAGAGQVARCRLSDRLTRAAGQVARRGTAPPPTHIQRIELLVERRCRCGSTAVPLSGRQGTNRARRVSRLLLDLVAVLWRRSSRSPDRASYDCERGLD
jgi:hypothetical protein